MFKPLKRKINRLIIHCAATSPSVDIGAEVIRIWHTRDNGWKDIGYHLVIKRDGTIEQGRPLEQAGAHVAGHNADSIGVCLVGGVNARMQPENNFTPEQWASLKRIVKDAQSTYNGIMVLGHRDLDAKKSCPSFDVREWLNKEGL